MTCKWAAFLTYPVRKEAEKLKKAKKPIQTSVKLVDLATGKDIDYPKVRQFAFARQVVAGDRDAAIRTGSVDRKWRGRRHGRRRRRIGRGWKRRLVVGQAERRRSDRPRPRLRHRPHRRQRLRVHVQQAGDRLAWTIDAEDKIGNGISVRDMKTGNVMPIDSGKASYEKAAWNEEATRSRC